MKIDIKEVMKHPYRLTLELTETELAQFQDVLHTVSCLKKQFTDDQREQAAEIDNRISYIWEE